MIRKLLLNSQIIWMVFINVEEYNLNKKRKILIVFDNIIAVMFDNKKLNYW